MILRVINADLRGITRGGIAHALNMGPDVIKPELDRMFEEGSIKRSRGGRYFIK